MLHQFLNLSRNLICLDTETTGLDPSKDRIVELAFQLFESKKGMTKEWRSLVNPGVPIPASATKVHGITNETMLACTKCGVLADTPIHRREADPDDVNHVFHPVPTFKQLAANLAKGFIDCDYAGKNCRYDLRILAAEFVRAGVEWSYAGARIIDADRLEALAEPRSLSHLHKKYVGHAHDGAHGALSDVRAAATVIVLQLKAHQQLPRDLDLLHKAQWPNEWLDGDGKFKMIDGVATCTFGKWRNMAMKDIPIAYYDWLVSADFPADVKTLARDAKLGKYPRAL